MEAVSILKTLIVVGYISISICIGVFIVGVVLSLIEINKKDKQPINKNK